MKSLLVEEKELIVQNEGISLSQQARVSFIPQIKFTMQPYHHPEIPLLISLIIKKTQINFSKENIEGVLKLKHVDNNSQEFVTGFFVELIQQEIQASTKRKQQNSNEAPPF